MLLLECAEKAGDLSAALKLYLEGLDFFLPVFQLCVADSAKKDEMRIVARKYIAKAEDLKTKTASKTEDVAVVATLKRSSREYAK